MRKRLTKLVAGFLLFLSAGSYGQDFVATDALIGSYPPDFSSPRELADRLARDFKTEPERVRGLFTWIATHIEYDMPLYREIARGGKVAFWYKSENDRKAQERKFTADLALKTLRSHKAVCQGYTALFRTVCNELGIDCIDISGTAKSTLSQIGRLPAKSNHVWNAVRIDGVWQLVDVTWAAGNVNEKGQFVRRFNPAYFCTPAERFFLNHFPEDTRLASTVPSPSAFARLPLYYSTYLQSECELVSPTAGCLATDRPVRIPFRFNGLPEDAELGYCFNGDRYLNRASVVREGDATYFEVPLQPGQKGYLTVFLNNRSLVAYKLGR